MTEFRDRDWSIEAIRDRFVIEDLYDRQLAAAEAHDWESYDTTFSADALVDLSDFGEPERRYPDYRHWLEAVAEQMPKALRLTGGLRLDLDELTGAEGVDDDLELEGVLAERLRYRTR